MKIIILSQDNFNTIMEKSGMSDKTVDSKTNAMFISINDCPINGEQQMIPYFKSNHTNVLTLYFDDVTEDIIDPKYGDIKTGVFAKAMTEEQGQQIVDFVSKINPDIIEYVFVHCAAGISRSGAVGTFIKDYFPNHVNKDEFKNTNKYIHPNPHILRILHNLTIYKDYQK